MVAASTLSPSELSSLEGTLVYARAKDGRVHAAKCARCGTGGARVHLEREDANKRPAQDRFSSLSLLVPLSDVYLTRGALKAARGGS